MGLIGATEKETPALGGCRAEDAISGGVRSPLCQPADARVKLFVIVSQVSEWNE